MKLGWGGTTKTCPALYADALSGFSSEDSVGQVHVPSLPSTHPAPTLCSQGNGGALPNAHNQGLP